MEITPKSLSFVPGHRAKSLYNLKGGARRVAPGTAIAPPSSAASTPIHISGFGFGVWDLKCRKGVQGSPVRFRLLRNLI